MEIGSFIELQFRKGLEWYKGDKNVARLNTGRSAIWHAFRVTGCKAIWIPYYQCDTIRDTFHTHNVEVKYYHIDKQWNPIDLQPADNEAVLLVNYYGIMSHERMVAMAHSYNHAIIDNCQAFFCQPVEGALNVYSCRKFVGVPDGAYLVGKDAHLYMDEYPQGYSSDTASFLLLRIEYGCEGKGYQARTVNEERIDHEPVMRMSKLTRTILDGADYEECRKMRRENFAYLHEQLGAMNLINPLTYYDEETIPMVYPLVVEDDEVIKRLYAAKHFQGRWWGYVPQENPVGSFEHWIASNIIPLTIDQRYDQKEMDFLVSVVKNH